MKKTIFPLFLIFAEIAFSQTFTSYFTGDTTDVTSNPVFGTVLMGGASENDNAMRWFLERADGGDVVVLRTTGEDGYNDYFYSDLGIVINSVQTIVCNSAAASTDPYIIAQIENAEALWFAGGDQWDYISFWRDTPIEDAINFLINEKQVPIGGTSAGSAIQGQAYFSAENGSIVSSQALNDPFHSLLKLGYNDFIQNTFTEKIITDTHYDNPDRRGRHAVFLARLYNDHGFPFYGIACEEYTAVCIDENNIAHAFGSYPGEEDYVYFIQVNCFEPSAPEVCVDGEKLTWNRDSMALKVIKMGADDFGTGTLDLNDWKTVGGDDYTWENWWVENGDFYTAPDVMPIDCTVNISSNQVNDMIDIYPNPADDHIIISNNISLAFEIELLDLKGNILITKHITTNYFQLEIASLKPSLYVIKIYNEDNVVVRKFIKN